MLCAGSAHSAHSARHGGHERHLSGRVRRTVRRADRACRVTTGGCRSWRLRTGWLAAYFRPEEDFAGLSFACLGSNPRDTVTACDLLAVSLLDIVWRPEAVRQLLDTSTAMVSRLLCAIHSDIDLWEASDEDLATVDPLWDALMQMPGVGTATASGVTIGPIRA